MSEYLFYQIIYKKHLTNYIISTARGKENLGFINQNFFQKAIDRLRKVWYNEIKIKKRDGAK